MIKYTTFLCFILLCACKSDNKDNKIKQALDVKELDLKEQKIKDADSDLAIRLYSNYINNPTLQAHKDENAIIDYAVSKNLDVTRTNSGLYYIITKEGTGPLYVHGQPCKADYQGYFLDGKVFDSSYKTGKPIDFSVGQMNAAWNEALKLMNTGSAAKLLIPSHLGYGERGFPGYVPPNTPLAFDLELLPLTN